jgi:hypothetical protein
MKTTDIILIVIAIFLLYSLYNDNRIDRIDKFEPNYIRIDKQDKPKIIEKFEGIEYYPIKFTIAIFKCLIIFIYLKIVPF